MCGPVLLVLFQLLELLLHVLHLLGDGVVLLLLLLLQRLLLQEGTYEEVNFCLDVLQKLLLPLDVLLLLLRLLAKILLGRLERAEGLGDAILAHLSALVLPLELLELLLQRREVCLRHPRLRVELVEVLVKAHALHDQLLVDVLLPVQALLHILTRLVCDLGALVHELQAHVFLGPLLLRISLHGRILSDAIVRILNVGDPFPLLVPQGVDSTLELLCLLADPVRVGLDLVVLQLVRVVRGPVGLCLLLHVPTLAIILLQLLLVVVLLLPHLLDLLLQQLDLLLGALDLGLRLRLPLVLALLQLPLLVALLVLQLRELDLQHGVLVLDDFIFVLNLQDLISQLLYALLVLL
mmetsp:Transcript_32022/g.91929  ORF Transcript_32022/g.91929 Transcript_32022/m.91929 type:complete len:351 (+) Transcript_32022:1628-2680(+)